MDPYFLGSLAGILIAGGIPGLIIYNKAKSLDLQEKGKMYFLFCIICAFFGGITFAIIAAIIQNFKLDSLKKSLDPKKSDPEKRTKTNRNSRTNEAWESKVSFTKLDSSKKKKKID